MELILWRHAEAEDGMPDLQRRLTAKGEKQAARMAEFLRRYLPPDTRILASPARRTQQTAQALGRHFVTAPAIAPGASPQTLLKAAGWPDGEGCMLLVGHQPTLGEVAALLLADTAEASWSIKKGAVWWFSRRADAHETVLRLAISPDLLDK